MQDLKNKVDDLAAKVIQSEGLVNKLENEIIEWDAHKKLCRRDEELGEIDSLLKEFKKDLKAEKEAIEMGKEKQLEAKTTAKDPKDIEDVDYLLEGIKNYQEEMVDLEKDITDLDNDRAEVFDAFDPELPSSIKEERNKRFAAAGKKGKCDPTSDKPEDMYYKLKVNA